ncbi:hypothetical protein ACIHCV_23060 [Streptomyces sp. NPDC051956]|uniref:hypothetical protein n=1 Tax=Streptomyces sp. NPDC051956 TaxID=3365677 RepID=UPI0037D5A53D
MNGAGAGREPATANPDFGPVHGPAALHTALADADCAIRAAPLTPQTRGMVDAATKDTVCTRLTEALLAAAGTDPAERDHNPYYRSVVMVLPPPARWGSRGRESYDRRKHTKRL